MDICSQADVFAMSSKREGLPVASLEAMYCGLPLVNSNIRGFSDVTENGVSGYVCPPDDVHGFAEGIERIKDNKILRDRMAENNTRTVSDFCLSQTLQEVEKMIGDLA